MTFDDVIDEIKGYESMLFLSKGTEYATADDRLRNFHQQGLMEGRLPSQVCMTLYNKHVVAMNNAVMTGSGLWVFRTDDGREGLKQRIVDLRIYPLLLAGLLEEERTRILKGRR